MPQDIVRKLWSLMESRDWSRLRSLLAEDFRATFPQSGEQFGPDAWVEVNRNYPGHWTTQLRQIVAQGPEVVTRVDVHIDGRVDTALSFFEVREGQILSLIEYWPEPFDIPAWRLSDERE